MNTETIFNRPLPGDRSVALYLFLASFIFYLLNLDFVSTGDTVYYANIIDTLRLDRLTTHQGYYVLGLIAKHLLAWPFGLHTDQALTVMSAFFGAAALGIAYCLLKHWLESERDALLATLILFLCHRFFVNSTSAEIYIVQSFFIWTSYLLFEQKRFYHSGISFAMAMWITPLSVFFGIWFLAAAWLRNSGSVSLMKVAVPVVFLYTPFLFFFYEELLWGNRGLINEDERRTLDVAAGATNFLRYQFKHYTFLTLLWIPALLNLRKYRTQLWMFLAAALPNMYVISQLRGEDNVFILGLDVYFVFWLLVGWRKMRDLSMGWLPLLLLVTQIIVFIITERPFVSDSHRNYHEELRAVGKIVEASDNGMAFMHWNNRMAFVYYNREKAAYPLEKGYWYEISFDTGKLYKHIWNEVGADPGDFDNYTDIYVLESWQPSGLSQLLLSNETIEKARRNNSVRQKVESFLETDCILIRPGLFNLYQCR